MSNRQFVLMLAIFVLVTNATTAAISYGLLYTTPSPPLPVPATSQHKADLPTRKAWTPPAERSVETPRSAWRDPVKALDPDAALSDAQAEIQRLKSTFTLIEIVKLQDGFGGTRFGVRFAGDLPLYFEGDRLPGTTFTIKSIDVNGEYIQVEHDLGIRVKLHLIR